MKIFNYSTLDCDRALWHAVARQLDLEGAIKDADLVDRKILTVVIHRQKRRVGDDRYLYGESGVSRIDIFPCRMCNAGTTFLTFLHEMAHLWLRVFHEDDSFEDWNETFCEEFARRMLRRLGGRGTLSKCHLVEFKHDPSKQVDAGTLIASCLAKYRDDRP
jgi:hypothetical protein